MTDGQTLIDNLLRGAPLTDRVVCAACEAVAECLPVGLPENWDGLWSRGAGWTFTCAGCLDEAEAIWREGASLADAMRRIGGGN